jgi:hypothetical protein
MTGTVDTGWHAGAEVLEKGHLIDPATVSYSGDLVLLVRPPQASNDDAQRATAVRDDPSAGRMPPLP